MRIKKIQILQVMDTDNIQVTIRDIIQAITVVITAVAIVVITATVATVAVVEAENTNVADAVLLTTVTVQKRIANLKSF